MIFNSLSTIRDAFKEDVFTGRPDFQIINIFSDNKKVILFFIKSLAIWSFYWSVYRILSNRYCLQRRPNLARCPPLHAAQSAGFWFRQVQHRGADPVRNRRTPQQPFVRLCCSKIPRDVRQGTLLCRSQAGTPVNLAYRFNLAAVNALWTMTTGTRFSQNDPQAIESIIKMNE